MKISELKPRTAIPEITLEVVSKAEARNFASERGSGKVCSLAAKDEDGKEVKVTLWNDDCTLVKEGDRIKIENGWCGEYQGEKQVSAGKFGKLTVLE
jgi:replication factor A1